MEARRLQLQLCVAPSARHMEGRMGSLSLLYQADEQEPRLGTQIEVSVQILALPLTLLCDLHNVPEL